MSAENPPAAIVDQFPRKVREVFNLFIPLADGTRLAARMWLPEDAEADPVPAILEYIPYRKRDATAIRDSKIHPYVAGHGYAVLRVDMRGSGDSGGVLRDEYLKLEQDDGLEIIAWIAAQPWCTGKLGMIGNSWGGFNGLQIAARRPPALKAIITSCSTDDRYADDVHYMGGCLLNDNMKWGANMFSHNTRPPDPQIVGDAWRAMWLDRLEGSGLWIEQWLTHQRRDAFWKHGSVCENYADIEAAVFAVGGWNDGYSNAIPRLMEHLSCPRLAWIGQWSHQYPHMAAPGPAVGFLQEAVRWWDHWLKGIDTGIMDGPMLRCFIQDHVPPVAKPAAIAGRWVGEAAWPPAGNAPLTLWLNRDGLGAAPGPAAALPILSPLTPGNYGRWCGHGLGPDMPTDQREIDGGALVFDSAPLPAAIDMLGAPVLTLDLSSDRPQAMICVRLGDVAPDGKVSRASYALLNLSHRDSHEFPAPLEPGRRYTVTVKLNDIGQTWRAGHRIRVAISTHYWPIAWTSPASATVTIYAGACSITLPVRPPRAEDAALPALPPPVQPPPLAARMIEKGGERRHVTREIETGTTTSHVTEDSGTVVYDDTGWTMKARQDQYYSITPDDPLSARAEVGWSVRYSRGAWNVETRTRTVMTATATDFRINATQDAFEDGARIHSKEWNLVIPRDNV
ncbi:MAG: CocE/NonD family hydrolase [Thalassobaculales bacterium]